jgi:hypothetical protein
MHAVLKLQGVQGRVQDAETCMRRVRQLLWVANLRAVTAAASTAQPAPRSSTLCCKITMLVRVCGLAA